MHLKETKNKKTPPKTQNKTKPKKHHLQRGTTVPGDNNISFSIQLARILIALSHIQQHSAKLFIHSSLRPRMSGRSLPISTTLRISDDGIQRKLDVELLEKKISHKEAKPLRFASLLASWLNGKIYLSPWTKQNKKPHSFHKHKKERRKERKGKYTGWSANHKAWDYKGCREARSQHAEKEAASQNLITYHVCVVLSFTDSEANQWNSRIVFNIFLCFLFCITFGFKLKPTSFIAWREKLGKQGGKTGKIRACSDIYCLLWGIGPSAMCCLNKTGTN